MPPQTLGQMLTGYWVSQALHVAARLGLADLLKDGPRAADDLARRTGAHAPTLYRLLRALASVGVFAEQGDGVFALTPAAEPLRDDHPESVRPTALMMGEEHYRAWGELAACVRTGETGFERLEGRNIFDWLQTRPDAARVFDAAMVSIHGPETAAMLDAYDFAGVDTLVDVGGGNGSLLREVLARHPGMKGVLYDLPHVVERARPLLDAAGLAERCQTVGGSFFESVPAGGDAYLLRHIIHDWDDARSLTILRNIRAAVPAAGRLLVVESVIRPGNDPDFAKWLDLNMLVVPGGMERTEGQYRRLYADAGFRLARVVPTARGVSVIEGRPV